MKRILFSILLVIAGIFQTKAQSLLTDGKVWHWLDFEASSYDFNRDIYGTYTIRVVGDTIVGGIKCKQLEKVWREDPSTASRFAALEKDSRLYGVFDSDEWMLREQLNFGLKVGDSCFYQAKVIATDEIEVHGVKRKRITIDNHNKQPVYIVEGIGLKEQQTFDPISVVTPHYGLLLYVEENGETIFTYDDFTPETKFYPEGTKWTEIRLDTLKHDSWYSKDGDAWTPNYERIDYYVKYDFFKLNPYQTHCYKCVYSNGPAWTDSLTFIITQDVDKNTYQPWVVGASVINRSYFNYPYYENPTSHVFFPGIAYQFDDWKEGELLWHQNVRRNGDTCTYGTIEEIKTGDFGGTEPQTYVDLTGTRIIRGIGVTEWNDGECLFGPVGIYDALVMGGSFEREPRNYRSMLVHFERDGKTLYDVWPEPGKTPVNITAPSVLSNGKDAGVIYDLQGRRLQKAPQRGLYIENGKKKGAVLP